MNELNTDGSVINLLPGETVDNIFDHLYNDIPTLSASSLVCRAWIPSCRYHLFHTLKCDSALKSRKTISHLHEWLLASPDVHPYIQTLNVAGWGGYRDVYVEDVEQVLQCLPFLQNLALDGLIFQSPDTSTDSVSYVSSAGQDRHLRSLVISSCTTDDVGHQPLCRMLGLFASVDRLAILESDIESDMDDAALSERTSSPQLLELAHRFRVCRELRLRSIVHSGGLELMRFLVDHSVHGDPDLGWSLRELWLKPTTLQLKGNRVAEATLIHHFRDTLQSIFLDLGRAARNDRLEVRNQANGSSEYCSALCLSGCTRTESLHLEFSPTGSPKPLPTFALQFYISCVVTNAEIVKHAPFSVKTITLVFSHQIHEGGKRGDLHPWDRPECAEGWKTMDAALTRLPKLTIVQLVLMKSSVGIMRRMDSAEQHIISPEARMDVIDTEGDIDGLAYQLHASSKQLLPRSYARGVVRIHQEI